MWWSYVAPCSSNPIISYIIQKKLQPFQDFCRNYRKNRPCQKEWQTDVKWATTIVPFQKRQSAITPTASMKVSSHKRFYWLSLENTWDQKFKYGKSFVKCLQLNISGCYFTRRHVPCAIRKIGLSYEVQ